MLLISNNKVYDALKYIAMVILPALGTLYFALAGLWNLGHANQVVGSIVALDAFLGVVLHLSNTAYNNSEAKYDGTVDVIDSATKKTFSLNFDGDPNDLDKQDTITLKVNKVAKPAKKATKAVQGD